MKSSTYFYDVMMETSITIRDITVKIPEHGLFHKSLFTRHLTPYQWRLRRSIEHEITKIPNVVSCGSGMYTIKPHLVTSVDQVIQAWSAQTGFQYRPTDIACAYYLGFITQVPMNIVFYTNAEDVDEFSWAGQTALLISCCTTGSRMAGFNTDGTLRNKTISMLIPAITYLISDSLTSSPKDLTQKEYEIAVRSINSVADALDLRAEIGCVANTDVRKILRKIDRMLSQKFHVNDLVN